MYDCVPIEFVRVSGSPLQDVSVGNRPTENKRDVARQGRCVFGNATIGILGELRARTRPKGSFLV